MFAGLNLGEEGVAVRLLHAGDLIAGPVLSGRNFTIRFDFEGAWADSIVKGNPPGGWSESFRIRRELLFQATVPAAASRISDALAEFRRTQFHDLINQILDLAASGGLLQAQNLCNEFCDRISILYWTADSGESSDAGKIEKRLLELDSAVENIPSASQLIFKGLAPLVPICLLAAAAWLLPLPFQSLWFWICGFAVSACAAHLMWCRWRAVQAATKAARLVANQIHREVRARVIALTREALAHEERAAHEQTEALKKRISKFIDSVIPLQFEQDRKPSFNLTRTIKRVPWKPDQRKVLEAFLREPNAFGRIRSEVRRFVIDALPGILDGTTAPEVLAAKIQSLSIDYCRQRFSRLSLAELLQNRLAENEEEASRLNSRPDVFLQNCVVNDCRSQPHRIRSAMFVPGTVEAMSGNDRAITCSMAENVWAVVARVEIAKVSELYEMRRSSRANRANSAAIAT